MKNTIVYGLTIILTAFCGVSAFSQDKPPQASRHAEAASALTETYGGQLGTIRFPVSCNEEARSHIERGMALLHHMTYEGARDTFAAASQTEPDCAMGYWGQAMTYIHPLWSDPPTEVDFEIGQTLVQKAKSRGEKTAREQAYIAAVDAYYKEGWNLNEKTNLASFAKGWDAAHRQFPEDIEVSALLALALLGTADPSDKTYAVQKRAGALAQTVLSQEPSHPGAHHYLIHAYDYPPLAKQALVVARQYGEIAPAVPHALHMPTHIFTRLGLWQEIITMNQRSAAAALKHPIGDKISMHYLHALDYLVYAYLQRGEDEKAGATLATLAALKGPFQVEFATSYALAAVPARMALERQQWRQAAALEARKPASFPWDKFPAAEAITHFARALGAARSGDTVAARRTIDKLTVLRDEAAKTSAYWAKQVDIQRIAAEAWLAFGEGRKVEALERMRHAADLEATTEKHPVTPGEVLPARELLADMLLETGRHQEALAQYLAALERSPNRLNSLYGAGRAAELMGDDDKATFYYTNLVQGSATGVGQERVNHARAFLAEN